MRLSGITLILILISLAGCRHDMGSRCADPHASGDLDGEYFSFDEFDDQPLSFAEFAAPYDCVLPVPLDLRPGRGPFPSRPVRN